MNMSNNHQVLIVDDDVVTRMALAGLLGRMPDVQIVEAGDGETAWEMLEQGLRPVVCCCDVHMPRLDGLALMKRAREHSVFSHLPFIMITASADRATVEAAIRQRASGFIIKPFAGVDTRTTVERVMRETLASRTERPASTRARLNLGANALHEMLAMLRQDALAVLEEVRAGKPASVREAHALRLSGACKTVGLWHAGELLGSVLDTQLPTQAVASVLVEVTAMAESQLALAAEDLPSPRRMQ